MPNIELKYSSDLSFDAVAVLQAIETTILAHDGGSGACKGLAYPADLFHHTHFVASVGMLEKPHRDAAFTAKLSEALEVAIKGFISESCHFSLSIKYGG